MSNEGNKVIKVTEYGDKKSSDKSGAKIDIYSRDPKSGPHDSIHLKVDASNKTYQSVTKINGEKQSSSGGCYLTSACLNHFNEDFDDNCYELTLLRWFRDNFVPKEDIEHYYEAAPIIVEIIDSEENSDIIYKYIYENIVDYCIDQINQGNYEKAYRRYKNSVLTLEELARPRLAERVAKVLKLRINNSAPNIQ